MQFNLFVSQKSRLIREDYKIPPIDGLAGKTTKHVDMESSLDAYWRKKNFHQWFVTPGSKASGNIEGRGYYRL